MVLLNLIHHVLRDAKVCALQSDPTSTGCSTSTNDVNLADALNINKYTFLVFTCTSNKEGPQHSSEKAEMDESVFVQKELGKFISSFEKIDETPTVIIYDKCENVVTKFPNECKAFIFTSKLNIYQEAELMRVLNVSRKTSIALFERNAPGDYHILNTVVHNILKADSRPSWPWNFTDTRIIYGQTAVKPIDGKLVTETIVQTKTRKVKGVFFINWMIPLCRSFASYLAVVYNWMKANYDEDSFEIFGIMFDIDKYSDDPCLLTMPWYTLKSTRDHLDRIKYTFGVSHVPSLVLLDDNDDIITRHGRHLVSDESNGKRFNWSQWTWSLDSVLPWQGVRPWNYYLIWDVPSLIIFGDGEDETYIDEWLEGVGDVQRTRVQRHLLHTKNVDVFSHEKLTRNQFVSGSAMLLHKSIDDVEFLTRYGLSDLGVPLAVIFDPFAGAFVCEDEDISVEIVKKFIAQYQKGELEPSAPAKPLPPSTHVAEKREMNYTTHTLQPPNPNLNA